MNWAKLPCLHVLTFPHRPTQLPEFSQSQSLNCSSTQPTVAPAPDSILNRQLPVQSTSNLALLLPSQSQQLSLPSRRDHHQPATWRRPGTTTTILKMPSTSASTTPWSTAASVFSSPP